MKVSALVFLLLTSTAVSAMQDEQRTKPDIDILITQLQLNETQATDLKNLMLNHRMKMHEVHKAKKEHRNNMRAMHETHKEELLDILNYEQMYKFHEYMRQFHPRPPGRH